MTPRQNVFKKIAPRSRYWKRTLRSRRPTLILIRNGTVTVRTAAGVYCARGGDSVLLAPGVFEIEATPAVRHGNVDLEIATFSMAALGSAFGNDSIVEELALGVRQSENTGVYVQKRVVNFLDRERAAVPSCYNDVGAIVVRIINSAAASTFPFARFAFFEMRWAFQSLLEAHVLRAGAVEWLAGNYIHGRAAFFRDCKTYVGLSPAKWIRTRRLELARAWIRHDKASLGDIAKALGYCNVRALRTALWREYESSIDELKDMSAIRLFWPTYVPMRPFWWPLPLPLIGRNEDLIVPERNLPVSKPEELFTEKVSADFFEMKPAAASKIIPFPTGLPTLLKAA